jgi:hypothetical protein
MTTATPIPALNSAVNDYTTANGCRISTPLYLDPTSSDRKLWLNAVRDIAHATVDTPVHSQSGIVASHSVNNLNKITQYLGMDLGVLRSVLFQRGGLSADLVIKLQIVTGIEVVTLKEIEAAYKAKVAVVKALMSTTP